MTLLNLGIVAHVDAGKTSLTERLLYEAGAIDAPGRVDDGTTRTDSMELERRRGITIRASVTSFSINDLAVTIIDTPGHPDFIAEVERSLAVLDSAVLVLSAVEGVQPQTVVIWRALQRLGVPTALFVNKIDRAGADIERVIEQVRRRLTEQVVPLVDAHSTGTTDAFVRSVGLTEPEVVAAVADVDDRLLGQYVDGPAPSAEDVTGALRRQVGRARLAPLLAGSAVTGAGLPELRGVLARMLPHAPEPPTPAEHVETSQRVSTSSTHDSPAATVFAVDRDDRGRRTWIRLWSGQIRDRDRIAAGDGEPQLVTEIGVSRPDGLHRVRAAYAGEIAAVRGLTRARIGNTIGCGPPRRTASFPPATLQALIEPVDPRQRAAMYAGLTDLADEDPLIGLRLDPIDGEAAVSLHGEVQKEVIAALLLERYGVATRFLPTSTVCLERVTGTGAAVERIKRAGNPYLATIGLRVERAPAGHGVEFSPGIERGNLPRAFIEATEAGVRAGLRQGPGGWEVTDCIVTMTESGYYPRQSRPHQKFDKSVSSIAADFRLLAPVVVHAALTRAGTRVCRPIDAFQLEVPDDLVGPVTALLGRLGGHLRASQPGPGFTRLDGHLPSAAVPDLAARLPDLTGGEGILITRLDHHAPAPNPVPTHRHRTPDPRDRETWFREVPR